MNLELDIKLTTLTKKYQDLNEKYEEIESEIDDLQGDLSIVESKMDEVEDQINTVKKELLNRKVEDLNIVTDNSFINDFVKASYFCDKMSDGIRPTFECVNITENELMGCDGYRAIVIRNAEIPDNLKSTKIEWSVRNDFEQHIEKELGEYVNISKIIKEIKDSIKYTIKNVTSELFDESLDAKVVNENYRGETVTRLTYRDLDVFLNKEYLDTALLCLNGQEFDVSLTDPLGPVLFENDKFSIIALPLRYKN